MPRPAFGPSSPFVQRFALRLLPFVAALVTLLGAAAPARASDTVAPDGNDPMIAVDAQGTAHIAFSSSTGSAPVIDDYSYCRVPRGTTTCAPRIRLSLPGGAGTGFGRAFVAERAGKVVVGGFYSGGQNVNGVWTWTSDNGGTSFGAAKRISTELSIHDAILGPGDNSVSVTNAVTGGGRFVNGSLTPASPAADPVNLGDGIDNGNQATGSSAVDVLNANTPVYAVMGGSRLYFRRFNNASSGGFNIAGNWLPPQLVSADADEPTMASGPSGTFLAHQTRTYKNGGYPLAVHRIDDSGTVGPATEIGGDGTSVLWPDLAEDASGRVAVAYLDNARDNRLVYQWSKRGVTWSDRIVLSGPDEDIRFPRIALAPDGGGFVVSGSANNNTPIKIWSIPAKGDEDPGVPVAPTTPGGPPVEPPPACPAQISVSTSVKAMVRSGDCFKDLGKGKFSTTGSVRVNGIDFTAPSSGTFTVDTKAHTVAAKGAYTVQAGSIKLQQGSRTWDVTQKQTIDELSAFGVKLFGLPIKGTADVSFDKDGAILQVNVELPSPFDGVRGITKLRTNMTEGLKLTGLLIHADSVPLGPVEVRDLNVVYTGENDGLEGKADFYLPPAAGKAVSAAFGFANGSFKHAELQVSAPTPPLPLPLWVAPPVTLSDVGFAAKNDDEGFRLSGGVKIAAGAPVAGLTPVSIDALPSSGGNGAYLFIPRKGGYAEIGAKGDITIVDIPVATGGLKLRTDGPLTFNGSANVNFKIIKVLTSLEGGINLSNADFYAGGKGSTCVSLLDLEGCANVSAILSSIGFAVCGSLEGTEKLTGLSVSIGLGFDHKWKGGNHLGSCRYDDYKPASLGGSAARARRLAAGGIATRLQAPAGAQTIVLPAGTERGVHLKGNGSLPGFTFAGPDGRTLTVAAGTQEPTVGANVAAVPVGDDEIELQVKKPAGTWTLTPAAGSTIAPVETAAALPEPKLSGSVGNAGGRARTLRLKTSDLGGQRLIVREVLPGGGTHELGTVRTAGSTTLKFTPTDGPAGKRSIEALLVNGDRQVGTRPITTYIAPAPAKLPAPRSVTLKRSSTSLTVRWKKVAGASRYRIRVTGSDGRLQILTAANKATSIKVADLTADDKVQIKVSAVSKLGSEGKSRAATSKAQKTKKPKAKKK